MPGSSIHLLKARNFPWRAVGPMERYFCLKLLGDFFAYSFDGKEDVLFLLRGGLNMDGVRRLRLRLKTPMREFDALLARDASLSAEDRVSVSVVMGQEPWLLQLFQHYHRA